MSRRKGREVQRDATAQPFRADSLRRPDLHRLGIARRQSSVSRLDHCLQQEQPGPRSALQYDAQWPMGRRLAERGGGRRRLRSQPLFFHRERNIFPDSGRTMLLPDQPGEHPHLMVETGKQGRIYLIDRDDMGGYRRCGPLCDDVVQIVNNGITGVHSTPAFFDNRVYYQGSGDVMKAIRVVNGLLQTPPDQSTTRFGFPGSSASISALGTNNGIAWALQTDAYGSAGASILHAYAATDLANELYNSGQTGLRDQAGRATKFTISTIANGKVYVGSANRLNVFGLFPVHQAPPEASPSDLAGSSPTYFQASLSWVNQTSTATGIKIERSTDGKTFVQVNTVPRDVTSYTDGGLRGSSMYFYRVRATNQIGDSPY